MTIVLKIILYKINKSPINTLKLNNILYKKNPQRKNREKKMRKFLILLIATSISLIGCDGINYYEKEDVVLTAGLIKSLGYNENSTVFNLRNLKITHISADAFNYFPNAVKIDLSYNKIKEINKETFDGLFVLIELLLNNNEIKHIGPNSFDSLVNLKLINYNFKPIIIQFKFIIRKLNI